MKTLKSILSGVAVLFVFVAFSASAKPIADKPTKADVVNIYIDAVNKGKVTELEKVLDNDLQFNMQRGERVNTLDKTQLLDYFNSNKSDVGAATTTTIISDNDDSTVVKIEFKYADYTRTDVVTISNYAGWKINNVNSTYK